MSFSVTKKTLVMAAGIAAALVSGAASATTNTATTAWTILDIGVQSGEGYQLSLNDNGVMLGTAFPYGNSTAVAFRWNSDGLHVFTEYAGHSVGIDVNATGNALINRTTNSSLNYVVAPDGSSTLVPATGPVNFGYGKILDDGRVVSLALQRDWTPAVTTNGSTQFLSGWSNGNQMNDVNGALQIASSVGLSGQGLTAAIWQNGANTFLDDGLATASYADEINEAGNIVAGRLYFGSTSAVAIWRDGVLENLGSMGLAPQSIPLDMNENGVIVGGTAANGLYQRAFMNDGTGFIDLSSLEDVSNAGWILTTAAAVNNRGQIAGTGFHNGVFSTYLLTPAGISAAVPEPESWAMLMAGLGLIGGVVRRRNDKAA